MPEPTFDARRTFVGLDVAPVEIREKGNADLHAVRVRRDRDRRVAGRNMRERIGVVHEDDAWRARRHLLERDIRMVVARPLFTDTNEIQLRGVGAVGGPGQERE